MEAQITSPEPVLRRRISLRQLKRQRAVEDVVVVPPHPKKRPAVIVISSSDDEVVEATCTSTEALSCRRNHVSSPSRRLAAVARGAVCPAPTERVVPVKQERDGGWPAEFQTIRQKPFDSAKYRELRAWFFTEVDVIAGVRESQTRRGTMRVTKRVTGRTIRIAEWPRLRETTQALHETGQHEQALQHLRCLAHYLQLVRHDTMPRILREPGRTGFVDGEDVDLTVDCGQALDASAVQDCILLDVVERPLLDTSVPAKKAAQKIKLEEREVPVTSLVPIDLTVPEPAASPRATVPGGAQDPTKPSGRLLLPSLQNDVAAIKLGAVFALEGANNPSVNGYYREDGDGTHADCFAEIFQKYLDPSGEHVRPQRYQSIWTTNSWLSIGSPPICGSSTTILTTTTKC
eukprot:COSAG02_NODE_8676_length_2483_cov_7.254067_2_plen_403_part_00